jgi:Carboxypeptidase regulatory-like domain/Viral BACON domain
VKPFDDILPEEQEPQHEELITLLQRTYSRPVMVPPAEQAQIIARVRERLVQADHEDSLDGDISLPQIGVLDSSPHQAVSPAGKPRRDRRRFRLMALLAAAMIIAVLLGTPLLLLRPWLLSTSGYNNPLIGASTHRGLPTLTLSPHVATIGTTIKLALKNFTPSTSVALTRDSQIPIHTDGGSSIITVGPAGSANVAIHIDSDWETGFHVIRAEDLKTRYTASATLLITGRGPMLPPHLQLDNRPLDVGAAVVGANSIRSFTLANSGGSSITWSASSKQAWLLVSPSQGTFSAGQTIWIAVQRVGLKPGDYKGDLAISSNVSPPQHVEVDMSVLPLPPRPVLALSPALLSFRANDGQPTPAAQTLTISNPGTSPLSWSLANQDQATATAQLSLLRALGPASNWLSASPSSGVVAPGATAAIQVAVSSQSILPGAYTGTLLFTAPGAVDSPQEVNVSLTVLPHCGIVTNLGFLAFTVAQGQTATVQHVAVSETGACARPVSWTATADPWLVLAPASGTDSGGGSTLSVNVTTANLVPGTYTGKITIAAIDSTGVVVGGSPQTIAVTLTVTGFTVSGSVVVCSGPAPACTTSQPLPGATVTLKSGSTEVASVTADAAGNYSFANVALGSYTLSASGTGSNGTHTGSAAVTVRGDTTGVTIQTF